MRYGWLVVYGVRKVGVSNRGIGVDDWMYVGMMGGLLGLVGI